MAGVSLGQSRAALHLHSVPFDVVSKMYTGILKPLIFDQNEQEYRSTQNFWGNPCMDDYVHMLTVYYI